ncbi:MAG: hypothetical protein K2X29_08720 [Candidatus Obscuribacterales bacterium]|nr:hypothetical protein [Candidatus Obscuribacterales bacterium]
MKPIDKRKQWQEREQQMDAETAARLARGMVDDRSIREGHVINLKEHDLAKNCKELRPSSTPDMKPTRETQYVVLAKVMAGGGDNGYRGDHYPDGLHIVAQQLHADGSLNPQGQIIVFRMSGCFCDVINEVQLKGQIPLKQESYNIDGKAVVIIQQP